jgi:DASH complex subunit DAM1
MADLEANFMHLQLMHESLSRFGESFASFLYGLNMRAFCVDFPEVSYVVLHCFRVRSDEVWGVLTRRLLQAPVADSIKRFNKQQRYRDQQDMSTLLSRQGTDMEMTFMSTDGSFVDSASMRATPKRSGPVTPAPSSRSSVPSTRGFLPVRGGRGGFGRGVAGADAGAGRGARGSGLARPRGRGIR